MIRSAICWLLGHFWEDDEFGCCCLRCGNDPEYEALNTLPDRIYFLWWDFLESDLLRRFRRCPGCGKRHSGDCGGPTLIELATCRTIGHSIDPMECDNVGCTCFRCGETFLGRPPRDDIWFWLTWYNARQHLPAKLRAFVVYIRPCDECGRRFCKRPLNDEHLPF